MQGAALVPRVAQSGGAPAAGIYRNGLELVVDRGGGLRARGFERGVLNDERFMREQPIGCQR